MLAMCAARPRQPERAVDALLKDTPKNTYRANGHNYQRPASRSTCRQRRPAGGRRPDGGRLGRGARPPAPGFPSTAAGPCASSGCSACLSRFLRQWLRDPQGLAARRFGRLEITPLSLYLRRREFMALGAGSAVGASLLAAGRLAARPSCRRSRASSRPFGTDEKRTPYEDVTGYNNYYEFGTDKADPPPTAAPSARAPGRSASRARSSSRRRWTSTSS
jgi:hypothetical protein